LRIVSGDVGDRSSAVMAAQQAAAEAIAQFRYQMPS
jgi:hypothetical protein